MQKAGPNVEHSLLKSTKHLKNNSNLQKVFRKKIKDKEMLPNSFYEASLILIPKPDKGKYKKGSPQAIIPDEHRCKNFQQNSSRLNSTGH